MTSGVLGASGSLSVRKLARKRDLAYMLRNRLRPGFWSGWLSVQVAKFVNRVFGVTVVYGKLSARHYHNGEWTDLGVLGYRKITTAYVNFLAAQHQTDSTEIGDFKYHDSGVGTTAENVADTAMETTDGESRATGTQVASTNTYTSVGTISYGSSKSITEHGLFSSAASTTLMDRTVFTAKAVVNSDRLEFTYVLTLAAGG